MDVDMSRIDIIYYSSTFCPIRHFDIRRFVPFNILAFNILSHSMLFLFDNLSHSTLCPIRPLLLSIFCPFDVLYHSIFCLFDILSHSTFWHSAFCPIRRFVVRRFVHSAFVTSTFCRWTVRRFFSKWARPLFRCCPEGSTPWWVVVGSAAEVFRGNHVYWSKKIKRLLKEGQNVVFKLEIYHDERHKSLA
jgi:hypothetical protein